MSAWLERLIDETEVQLRADDPRAADARSYLHVRGVDEALWGTYRIGVATDATPVTACAEDFQRFAANYWTDTLVFPCYGPRNELLGIQTRPLGEKAYHRYDLADPAVSPIAYGGQFAFWGMYANKPLVVVEGIFDYFAVAQVTDKAVLATVTAHTSRTVQRWIARYARQVIILFDMDDVGRDAADKLARALHFLDPTICVSVPVYSRHDPGEFAQFRELPLLKTLLNR